MDGATIRLELVATLELGISQSQQEREDKPIIVGEKGDCRRTSPPIVIYRSARDGMELSLTFG
jgi:hypothetical protein